MNTAHPHSHQSLLIDKGFTLYSREKREHTKPMLSVQTRTKKERKNKTDSKSHSIQKSWTDSFTYTNKEGKRDEQKSDTTFLFPSRHNL